MTVKDVEEVEEVVIVYGEMLFLENMMIGGVLLYLTGEVCGKRNGFRLIIGSMMCGAFSLVMFLEMDLSQAAKGAVSMVMEAFFAVCVCTVVFGLEPAKRIGKLTGLLCRLPWKTAAVFILVTYFMGGITMALLLLTKQQGIYTASGIYTGDIKAVGLVLCICMGYLTVKQVVKIVRNKKLYSEHTYEAEITIDGHIHKVSAFLDTGNRLKEPITGKPVAVASEELWERMIGAFGDQNKDDLMNTRYALIPYEAVGTNGVLEAIRTDYVTICPYGGKNHSADMRAGKKTTGCYIARSERKIMRTASFDAGYDLLISGEMAGIFSRK